MKTLIEAVSFDGLDLAASAIATQTKIDAMSASVTGILDSIQVLPLSTSFQTVDSSGRNFQVNEAGVLVVIVYTESATDTWNNGTADNQSLVPGTLAPI